MTRQEIEDILLLHYGRINYTATNKILALFNAAQAGEVNWHKPKPKTLKSDTQPPQPYNRK